MKPISHLLANLFTSMHPPSFNWAIHRGLVCHFVWGWRWFAFDRYHGNTVMSKRTLRKYKNARSMVIECQVKRSTVSNICSLWVFIENCIASCLTSWKIQDNEIPLNLWCSQLVLGPLLQYRSRWRGKTWQITACQNRIITYYKI